MAENAGDIHVAVDGHRMVCEPTGSGASYLRALLQGWAELPHPPRVSVFVPAQKEVEPAVAALPNVETIVCKRPCNPVKAYRYQLYWQQLLVLRMIRQTRPDVYLSPFHLTPLAAGGVPVVTTIHDLCFLDVPFFSVGSLVHRAQLWSAINKARRLICVSDFTRRQLIKYSPSAAKRARVVHNGASRTMPDRSDGPELAFGLHRNSYFLWVGSPAPYKNIELLMSAFAEYRTRAGSNDLVVITPSHFHLQFHSLAAQHSIGTELRLLTPVSGSELDLFYRNAVALVFPSSCEGFGFPTLEAAAQGCPTVAYCQTPAHEILGDTLPLAEELSSIAFAGLMDLYTKMPEIERLEQSKRLMGRASLFSSQRMAAETLTVLQEATRETR